MSRPAAAVLTACLALVAAACGGSGGSSGGGTLSGASTDPLTSTSNADFYALMKGLASGATPATTA